MSLLALEGVTKRFGAQPPALQAVTLFVEEGEFVAVLGDSGSGKSTLLRVIAGFEAADSGRVFLDGADVTREPPHRRRTAMVFQGYALFPHLSVRDNIAYGLRRGGVGAREIAVRVEELLAATGLDGLADRRPDELSGGQRQRVAIARALARRPPVLLLDEPLSALDAKLRERTGAELRAIQRREGAAFVMVTHDQAEALALADRVAVLRAGRLLQVGTPRELWERPVSREVAEFLGGANILAPADAALSAALPAPLYALRPERIRLVREAPAVNGGAGEVEAAEFRGASVLLTVRGAARIALRVRVPGSDAPRPGDRVALAWEAEALAPLPA